MQGGRIGVYGDSNCLDSSHRRSTCNQLLLSLLRFIAEASLSPPKLLML